MSLYLNWVFSGPPPRLSSANKTKCITTLKSCSHRTLSHACALKVKSTNEKVHIYIHIYKKDNLLVFADTYWSQTAATQTRQPFRTNGFIQFTFSHIWKSPHFGERSSMRIAVIDCFPTPPFNFYSYWMATGLLTFHYKVIWTCSETQVV